ncbi:MAG: ORF6N domain-containing protein [Bacilli bacterium]|nr:ORF6N domain-containing protein [Bacilli bacterium]
MNNLLQKDTKIENMIYEIRAKQVMLDSDLARLYGVETKYLKRQVNRNIERFPKDFLFQLSKEEYKYILRCQNGTLEIMQGNFSKYLPYVFTEQGVAMLSGIIRSEKAIKMNIKIMRAFVSMRHYLNDNKDIYKNLNHINNKLVEYDDNFNYLFSKFDKKEKLYLSGEEYDAYSDIVDIFNKAEKELIIIDSYVDKSILDIIRSIKTKVILITKNNRLTKLDIVKYNKQYNNLKIINTNKFHDRYFIIDKKEIYHCGTSINHAGSKVFSINKLEDKIVKDNLIKYVNNMI